MIVKGKIPEIIVEYKKYGKKLTDKEVSQLNGYFINKNQIVSKGYGETQPTVSNTNSDGSDNPANRQLNRRCELKVIGIKTVK